MEEKEPLRINLISLIVIIAVLVISVAALVGFIVYKIEENKFIEDDYEDYDEYDDYEELDDDLDLELDDDAYIDGEDATDEELDFGNKIEDEEEYVYVDESYGVECDLGDEKLEYSVWLPIINVKSSEVQKINDEWAEYYEKTQNSLTKTENGYTFDSLGHTYSVLKNGILNVVINYGIIEVPTTGEGFEEKYKTYNIEIETGKIISNSELFEKFNLTKENVNELINDAIKEEYEDLVSEEGKDKYNTFEDYLKDVKYEFTDIDSTQIIIYPDSEGISVQVEGIILPNTDDTGILIGINY